MRSREARNAKADESLSLRHSTSFEWRGKSFIFLRLDRYPLIPSITLLEIFAVIPRFLTGAQRSQARQQHSPGGHDGSSSRRLTIATVRSHSSVSAASWRPPARVIE